MANQTEYYFKRKKNIDNDLVSLDYQDLQILSLIEQNKSLKQIKQSLRIDAIRLKERITTLYKKNLITLVDDLNDFMELDFADHIRQTLIDLLGPVGPIILDDALSRHNMRDDRIPKTFSKAILREIAKDIPDDEQRNIFLSKMIDE